MGHGAVSTLMSSRNARCGAGRDPSGFGAQWSPREASEGTIRRSLFFSAVWPWNSGIGTPNTGKVVCAP